MASVEFVTAPIGAAGLATGSGESASTSGEFESALNEAQLADGGQRLDGRPQSGDGHGADGSEPDVPSLAKGDLNLTARLVAIRAGQQWAGSVVASLFQPDARLSTKGSTDAGVDAPDTALETHEQSGVPHQTGETVVVPPILTPIVEWTFPAPASTVGLPVGAPGNGLVLDSREAGGSQSTLPGDGPIGAHAMSSLVEGPERSVRDASLAEPATHFDVSAVESGLESVRTEETLGQQPDSSAELEAMSATLAGPGARERAIESDLTTPQAARSVVSERAPQSPEPPGEQVGWVRHAIASAVERSSGRQSTEKPSADELHPTRSMSANARQIFAGGRSTPYSAAALAPQVAEPPTAAEPSGSDASEFEVRFSADQTRAANNASTNVSGVTASKRARGTHEEPIGDPRKSAESASRASARLTAALFDVSDGSEVRATWTDGEHATVRPLAPLAPSARETAPPAPPAPLPGGSVNQTTTPSAEPARTAVMTVSGDGAGIPDRSVELHGQIVQALRMQWTSKGGDVRIQLEPDYLGELAVSLTVNQGRVVAHLTASSPDVRQWIETNEAALRQSLAHHDLTLERMIVKEENASASGHPDQESPEADRQRQRPRPRRPAPDATFEVVV